MSDTRKALLLIGSPKAKESVSAAIGGYLTEQLATRGWTTDSMRIAPSMRTEEGRGRLLAAVSAADLLVLSYPLYIDSLPATVIEAMEAIAASRRDDASPHALRMVAIVNCGFPEAAHNDVSLRICRRFATEAGIRWAGGLPLGAGPMLGGKSLRQAGGQAAGIVRALDMAAGALDAGEAVPAEAQRLMAKPLVPAWLYAAIGNFGWLLPARQNRVLTRLAARPYARRGD